MSARNHKQLAQDDAETRHCIWLESKMDFMELLCDLDGSVDIEVAETLLLKNGSHLSSGNIQCWLYYCPKEHKLIKRPAPDGGIFEFFCSYLDPSVQVSQFKQTLYQLAEYIRFDPAVMAK